ncbi:unnamed protein product [Rotaria magnacalcarata]|uniref:Uncharacterized protein n=4 Tax=Rotaria magnacalcarata TaxID=392030 RepID=A0A819MZ00_9BILA|nr:unnamed protein product [Rotaria magnacalcarata]CAF4087283.1 unnamed protein product [Rotaria magnacalcarata]
MIPRNSSSRSFSYILISCAFILAFLFEMFCLNIFCSSELSADISYECYSCIHTNLSNETISLISFMKNQPSNQSEIDCISNNATFCPHDEIVQIVRHHFDQHERPIVGLIHKIQLSTIGVGVARNEIRLKYHYHTCQFRNESNFFLLIYNLLYPRKIGFNRYISILAMGSIIPSIITVLTNAISFRWIIAIRSSLNEQSRLSQRRTEDTRRVITIITIECILAVINSWLIDIILSIKYCGFSLAIGDDCPSFLSRFHRLLVFNGLLNSMSNIILCSCTSRRFRQELKHVKYVDRCNKKHLPCYCYIAWKTSFQSMRRYDDENCMAQSDSSSKRSKTPKSGSKQQHHYIR